MPAAAPDEQYTIPGVGLGAEVYVWRCVAGKHIVVAKTHDEWVCSSATMEESACGATTKMEERAKERGKEPVLKAWPGTSPSPP